MEYGTNTAVYGQMSVEYGRVVWRYSDLRRPVIFLLGSLRSARRCSRQKAQVWMYAESTKSDLMCWFEAFHHHTFSPS